MYQTMQFKKIYKKFLLDNTTDNLRCCGPTPQDDRRIVHECCREPTRLDSLKLLNRRFVRIMKYVNEDCKMQIKRSWFVVS